ncbi:MAG: SAM-dependent methyltransferase, partial [Actinomycetota bacterium]|nr:SAM-dependent methyltransferase [Actinomycetota bacterium]
LLLSDRGREAVALAAGLDLSPAARIATAEALRDAAGPDLGPLALEQALLRRRARAKHPRGDELWWTAEALEQATAHEVAVHRATRYPEPVLDLCCSVGGDLLALPAGSVGVDLDEARLLLAAENARVLGRSVRLVRADVTRLRVRGDVFADPARRSAGRRVFDARAYAPPLEVVLGWLPQVRSLGIKVAPGLDPALVPEGVEREVVSLRGEVKEAVLWAGRARRAAGRSAALLPGGHVLSDVRVPDPAVRPPGRWLLEPDGAVIRAGLVAQVADAVGGGLLDATIAYVTADEPVPTPFGTWYEVLEVLPFGVKRLRAALRTYDAGPLVVKKRGTAVEPEVLRKALGLRGGREVTVVLTRSAGRQIALVVRPHHGPARTPAGSALA